MNPTRILSLGGTAPRETACAAVSAIPAVWRKVRLVGEGGMLPAYAIRAAPSKRAETLGINFGQNQQPVAENTADSSPDRRFANRNSIARPCTPRASLSHGVDDA